MSFNDDQKKPLDKAAMMASRARNRTVMLSSDMTGQVRSMIQDQGDAVEPDDLESPSENPTNENGFLSPSYLNSFKDTSSFEKALGKEEVRVKTELIGNDLRQSVSGTRIEDGKFGALSRGTDNYDRPIPASVKDILNTKEFSRGKVASTESSTLNHHTPTSFDAQREVLSKSREGFRKSRILGFFISFDLDEHGEIVEIREGRSIISSKYMDQSDMLFIDDDSISNPHAVIKADKKGNILLLDQLSEAGSSVIRSGHSEEIDAVGTPVELRQGDIIRLGSRYFVFCAVPKIAIQD